LTVVAGCASTSTDDTASAEQQPRYVPKTIAVPTAEERLLLTANGYAVGTWSDNCSDPGTPKIRYFAEGEKFVAEASSGGKVVRRSEMYDVRKVSDGVIKFKSHAKDYVSGREYVAETKSGFVGNKRMVFDQTIIYLIGPGAGEPVVTAKDGYEVSESGGALVKGKRLPVMTQC
jgi:hypothetical protein